MEMALHMLVDLCDELVEQCPRSRNTETSDATLKILKRQDRAPKMPRKAKLTIFQLFLRFCPPNSQIFFLLCPGGLSSVPVVAFLVLFINY